MAAKQLYSTGVAIRGFVVSMCSLLLGASVVHNIYNPILAITQSDGAGGVDVAEKGAAKQPSADSTSAEDGVVDR